MADQLSQEADILLSLCIKIASVKAKNELLTVINNELGRILPFDGCMILRYNRANRTAYSYISGVYEERHNDVEYPISDDSINDAHTPILNYDSSLLPVLGDGFSRASTILRRGRMS